MCETEIVSCRVLNNKSYYHCFTANPIELVGATSLHLLSQTALPLKSPTGAFIAAQTRTFRKVQNGEDLFPMKIFTAPQHIRSILPPIHPTKSSLRCVGGIFLFHK